MGDATIAAAITAEISKRGTPDVTTRSMVHHSSACCGDTCESTKDEW
jgi:hypothetical protein